MKKIVAIILALLVALGLATTVAAQTVSTSVELPTRSILLIDKSGSMEDQKAAQAKFASLDHEKCRCLWWLALLLGGLLAMLFDLIHELITRKRGKEEKGENQQPVETQQLQHPQPCTCQQSFPCRECPFEEYQMEQAVIAKLQNGANLLLDMSGSMTSPHGGNSCSEEGKC